MVRPKIVYVDYGVANVIQGVIYMHEGLKSHPELHDHVLAHEMKHIDAPDDKSLDWVDVTPKGLTLWMIKNPTSLMQVLPVWIMGGKLIYSKTMILFWFMILLIVCVGVGLVWMI